MISPAVAEPQSETARRPPRASSSRPPARSSLAGELSGALRPSSVALQRKCSQCSEDHLKEKYVARDRMPAYVGPTLTRRARPSSLPVQDSGSTDPVRAPTVQRACAECAKEEDEQHQHLDRSADATHVEQGGFEAPSLVDDVLRQGGTPLDGPTEAFFASRFGVDFSQVRVHADADAARSAHMVGARAYTVGSHIAFGAGHYSPHSTEGRQLLAHELTHVVQQTGPSRLAGGLQRQTQPTGAQAAHVTRLASLLESYAQRADTKLPTLGSATRIAPVQAELRELRAGIGRMRQVAQRGDERECKAVLSAFSPEHLRSASRVLVPASEAAPSPSLIASQDPLGTASPPAAEVASKTPVGVATKPLIVGAANTPAEAEADSVAAAVMGAEATPVAIAGQPLSMQRYLDQAAYQALEKAIPEVAEATAVTEEAAVAEETAVVVGTALGMTPVGWAILAVVAIAAVGGYLYYRSRAPKPQTPEQQPEQRTDTQTQTETDTRATPKECEDIANRLSTPNCRMTASLAHAGGDPLADLFCEEKTGSPCEFRVVGASGRAYFDAIRGNDVYECKCGYQSLVDAINRGDRYARFRLDDLIEQVRRHLKVSQDCGLQYRIIVSNEAFAEHLRELFGNQLDVIVEPFEPCD
jgi:hypothetical protein